MRDAPGRRAHSVRASLSDVRADPRQRAILLAGWVAIGLAIALVHWVGFIVAGLAIGLAASSARQAIGLAAVVGLVAAIGLPAVAAWHGQLEGLWALRDFLAIAVAMAIGLTILGASVYGLVPVSRRDADGD